MRAYGPNKATEFGKRDLAPVYKLAKSGSLKVEKWIMSHFYDMADYYGIDFSGAAEQDERWIMEIIDAVKADEAAKAQELIDWYTNNRISGYGIIKQKKFDRTYIA